MATYTIYSDGRTEDAVFLHEGFSWGAFAFGFIWAAWHRLWIAGSLGFAAVMVSSTLPPRPEALVNVAAALLFGVFGNDMRRWSLARRGLADIGAIEAETRETAELLFFATRSLPPVTPVAGHDVLGLFGAP
jgi:Protein of unknown function (DUF2628)